MRACVNGEQGWSDCYAGASDLAGTPVDGARVQELHQPPAAALANGNGLSIEKDNVLSVRNVLRGIDDSASGVNQIAVHGLFPGKQVAFAVHAAQHPPQRHRTHRTIMSKADSAVTATSEYTCHHAIRGSLHEMHDRDSSFEGQNRRRVLVADDERVIADTLQKILNQNGFEAVAVYGGQDAVDAVREWLPDIFLADVVMPAMNGIEAAIRILRMIPECRVLLISGNIQTPDLRREAQLLGNDFEWVQKPIHPEELLERLRAL